MTPPLFRNVFRAYWSMATVLSLMELHSLERGFQYDAVILARPDVWFHVDTDLPRQGLPAFSPLLCCFALVCLSAVRVSGVFVPRK